VPGYWDTDAGLAAKRQALERLDVVLAEPCCRVDATANRVNSWSRRQRVRAWLAVRNLSERWVRRACERLAEVDFP
jgi:hypothetical protein